MSDFVGELGLLNIQELNYTVVMQWLLQQTTFDSDQICHELALRSELVILFHHTDRKSSDLTREILSKLTQTALDKIELVKNEHGKPFWPNSPWRFNASDSGEWMLLGFSKNRLIGVDIERERELRHAGKFPERIMTEWEQKDYTQVPEDIRLKRLIQSWSLKEAILKCQGGSFFRDAHRIDLGFHPLGLRAVPSDFGALDHWTIAQKEFTDASNTFQISLALFLED